MTKVIDNDYHPVDSDLSATDDHWGTQLASNDVPRIPSPAPIAPISPYEHYNVSAGQGKDVKPMKWNDKK